MPREPEISEVEVMKAFAEAGAIISDDHFVYTKGDHGNAYVDKAKVSTDTQKLSILCKEIANQFVDDDVDVVVGPVTVGLAIAQWVAHGMNGYITRRYGISALFADKGEKLPDGTTSFVLKRGYDELVRGKRVLVVDDICNSGGSVRNVVCAVRECGGKVVGVGVLCNRGGVTARDLGGVPRLFALMNITLQKWSEEECLEKGPCSEGVPVNTKIGHGKEFLAKKKEKAATT